MARGGHNAKTNEELKANGTFRKVYHADRKSFELLDAAPPSPFPDKRRSDYWDHFTGLYVSTQILTKQHLDAIETLCNLRADLDDLDANIQKDGITFTTDTGQIKANPSYSLKLQTQAQILRIYEQFGGTPRTSMTLKTPTANKEKVDPFEELMKMGAVSEASKPKSRQAKA
jgi:P27 family predicted phage terminase small subunit